MQAGEGGRRGGGGGVFFFKQEAAYEVGAGDWSSDVCSSDQEPSEAISRERSKVDVSP